MIIIYKCDRVFFKKNDIKRLVDFLWILIIMKNIAIQDKTKELFLFLLVKILQNWMNLFNKIKNFRSISLSFEVQKIFFTVANIQINFMYFSQF